MRFMRYTTAGMIGLILVSSAGVAVRAQQVKLPPVVRTTLGNGAEIVLMEYHRAPTFTLTAIFPGGTSGDAAGKSGTAELTADLLRRGTEKRTATQIAEEIDFLGGSLGAGAGDDRYTVALDILAKDTDAGLELLNDIVRHPQFPDAELERERTLSLSGLQSLGEDPGAIASRVANEITYGAHPYGRDATITSLKTITRADLLACYKRDFVPNHLILVAVGDFNAEAMTEKLKARFGDWQRGTENTNKLDAPAETKPRTILIDKPDATQTQVRWVRTAFPRSSPDYYTARLASTILGGGFTSRLIDEIRVNRSLTYGISSSFGPHQFGGSFDVSTFTKIETTKALLDATTAVLQKTADKGFTDAELKKTKGFLTWQFAVQVQTPEALAGVLADVAFYNLPPDYLSTYLAKLNAVTLADVNRIARTYFAPNKLALVLVAPAAQVRSQLTGLDRIETRPVASVGK